ncbi:MAG: IPExxxVDY family protein [Bacteroidales bacterium]|nr:IPExxxVDY family protein [Bacteroidales bacterium]
MKARESSKKVHKLKIDTQFPFSTIGISSHENDYRLIWAINAKLNTKFAKINDFNVYYGADTCNAFSRYFFEDEDSRISFYILSNRCDNGYLVPEYRVVDYFLFLKGEIESSLEEEIIHKLKQVNIIATAFAINNKTIKSIKKILHLDA